MVLLLSTGHLQRIEAQQPATITCDPVELSWCLQAIVSPIPPTPECCQKLKGQEPCLCRELGDPTFGGFLKLP
ncbi:putative bifunctional inhibitor/plant lipid transfer protein/seed storage helical, partial [Tanacetum coccineum]